MGRQSHCHSFSSQDTDGYFTRASSPSGTPWSVVPAPGFGPCSSGAHAHRPFCRRLDCSQSVRDPDPMASTISNLARWALDWAGGHAAHAAQVTAACPAQRLAHGLDCDLASDNGASRCDAGWRSNRLSHTGRMA